MERAGYRALLRYLPIYAAIHLSIVPVAGRFPGRYLHRCQRLGRPPARQASRVRRQAHRHHRRLVFRALPFDPACREGARGGHQPADSGNLSGRSTFKTKAASGDRRRFFWGVGEGRPSQRVGSERRWKRLISCADSCHFLTHGYLVFTAGQGSVATRVLKQGSP